MIELLTPKEVSKILRVSVATLANWRSTKRYDLPYIKLGKVIRYRIEDVEDFVDFYVDFKDRSGTHDENHREPV